MEVRFNPKQQEVFNQLKAFVNDPTVNTFILNGYAGTGKTFLIQHFAKYLQEKKKGFKLLASTGRAAAVLRGKTDLETSTIHGELYSFDTVDGDDNNIPDDAPVDAYGQMTLVFTSRPRGEEDCIYIVDEASMVGSEFTDSTSYAKFGSGCLLPDLLAAIGKSKIVFVGDPAQLPPVFQVNSPALDKNWLNDMGRTTVVGTLNQIMRTEKDNDILVMAEEVRNSIGVQETTKWIKLKALNHNNCTVFPDANTLFLEYYSSFLQFGPNKSIAIAPSNRICNHLNSYVRKRLYPQKRDQLEVGEILMVNQNNYIVPLVNGDFVKVIYLGEKSKKLGLHFQDIRVEHLATEKSYAIKIALDAFNNPGGNLNHDQQRLLMIDFSRRMRKKGIRPKTDKYFDRMRLDPYLNSLRAGYGYVVTCHKAQGGEWNNVFLFLDKSMYGYMKPDAMRQWWYTAITRTKKQLHLHRDWWIR